VLLICAGLGGSAGGEDSLLPLTVVPPEESGLTHQVKILSTTVTEGIKYPWMSSLVDINADGHLDIMYYGHHGGGAAIWFGNGDGTFELDSDGYEARWVFGARDPVWLDVNGDGAMDAVGTEGYNIKGFLYMNTGDGHFGKTSLRYHGNFVDLDHDGHHDELWQGRSGAYDMTPGIHEWGKTHPESLKLEKLWMPEDIIPWPEGVERNPHPLAPQYHSGVSADLDGDTRAELIVTFSKKMLSWVLKRSEGVWTDRTAEMGLPAGEPMWLYPDDLDVDGDMDLVDMWNGWWFANDGKGKFTRCEHRIFDPEARKRGHPWDGDGEHQFIDLDNNGFRDITFAGDHSTATGAFLNMGGGKFVEIEHVNGSRRHRKFGDVDGDYDLDMVRCDKMAEFHRNETLNNALKLTLVPKSWAETVVGCTVWVYREGKLGDSDALIHHRQCFMERGMHRSTVLDTTLHVGLGSAAAADVRVRFADGTIREARGVKAKTTATLTRMSW
jgi:hypothetical protein